MLGGLRNFWIEISSFYLTFGIIPKSNDTIHLFFLKCTIKTLIEREGKIRWPFCRFNKSFFIKWNHTIVNQICTLSFAQGKLLCNLTIIKHRFEEPVMTKAGSVLLMAGGHIRTLWTHNNSARFASFEVATNVIIVCTGEQTDEFESAVEDSYDGGDVANWSKMKSSHS